MTFSKRSIDRSAALGVISAAFLVLLSLPGRAEAASYFVVGRVYSASPLAAGDTAPANPLTGVPAEQVIGADLVASVPRNLVKVRVLAASDGSELASYITRQDGGYLASVTAPAGGLSVRFVVDELATSQQLLFSEPISLTAPVTVRYLLLNEEENEISGAHKFAPKPVAPAMYTAIFTRVGKIELATTVGGVPTRLIDTVTGLANVPGAVAADLSIPDYQDAPFGGNLFLFGAFSQALYSLPGVYYRIKITPNPNPSDPQPFAYMSDELVKTKYTVNFTTGTVDTAREILGPLTVGAESNLYKLTPIAASNNELWSFPDLLALWRTGGLNGVYKLKIELVAPPAVLAAFAAINNFTDVTLRLDNVAPEAQILPLSIPPEAADFDTPRVYSGPVPAGFVPDLTATRLGLFSSDYGGSADPTCLIFSLQPAAPTKYLAFKLTAHHAGSFLHYWQLSYERNDKKNELVMGKQYNGVTNAMDDIPGRRISSAQTSASGFENMFLYLDSDHLQPPVPPGSPLGGCAYRFVLRAATRTTDGYNYLTYAEDQDLHYVLK